MPIGKTGAVASGFAFVRLTVIVAVSLADSFTNRIAFTMAATPVAAYNSRAARGSPVLFDSIRIGNPV